MRRNFLTTSYSCTLFLGFLILVCCNRKKQYGTKLIFHIHHAYGHQVYLEAIPFADEKRYVIDSAMVKNGNDLITFNIPKLEERPYKLRVSNSRLEVVFINDTEEIIIEGNIFKPNDYRIEHSPATVSVKLFLDDQSKLVLKSSKLQFQLDSLRVNKASIRIIDSISRESSRNVSDLFQQYINYSDTVSSPGAFLYIYNNVDFGNNYEGLKKFILKAADRFPANNRIQYLKNETLDYLKTFEIEYNDGDYLPELHLPNQFGQEFSTSFLKGKYVFMDFWSTWCDACLKYDKAKETASKIFPADKFEIVSIALDSEKDVWKHYIEAKNYNWIQLIDEKIWQGPTLKTYRIDSIPFNFLLAPDGRILSKAIKPDSVIIIISKAMK
jgi:thiol-disulfide isomerase/thioredoxin